MNHKIYLIKSIKDFNSIYSKFKKSADILSTPSRYVIGFDIEYISKSNTPTSFLKYKKWALSDSNENVACLIQMSSLYITLLIHLPSFAHSDISNPNKLYYKHIYPSNLLNILTKESWIKMGVGIDNDLSILSDNLNLKHCSGSIELSNIALMSKINNPSLVELYNSLFQSDIKKSKVICDWSQDLDIHQIKYAAKDSIISYNLGIKILSPSIDSIYNYFNNNTLQLVDLSNISYLPQKIPQDIHQSITQNNSQNMNYHNSSLSQEKLSKSQLSLNFVCKLNEISQKKLVKLPQYTYNYCENSEIFTCKCNFMEKTSNGTGRNKKSAKMDAAKNIYKLIFAEKETSHNDNNDPNNSPDNTYNYIGQLYEIAKQNNKTKPKFITISGTKDYSFGFKCLYDGKETLGYGFRRKDAKYNASKNMFNLLLQN